MVSFDQFEPCVGLNAKEFEIRCFSTILARRSGETAKEKVEAVEDPGKSCVIS